MKATPCFNSFHQTSEEPSCDSSESIQKEKCMQERRLLRLYGSNARNIRRGRKSKKPCAHDAEMTDENKVNSDTVKKSRDICTKFTERERDEKTVEIHADNYNINQPWFVGYQNSNSLCGCPQALASRYGYNSAIRITKQCSARTSVNTSNLEDAYKLDAEILKSDLAQVNKWDPPLKAEPYNVTSGLISGKGHYSTTPKMWPSGTNPSRAPCTFGPKGRSTRTRGATTGIDSLKTEKSQPRRGVVEPPNTKQLDRAIRRETEMWRNIARKAKAERMMVSTKKNVERRKDSVSKTSPTASKSTLKTTFRSSSLTLSKTRPLNTKTTANRSKVVLLT